MKNILTTLFFVLLFCNSSCKEHSNKINEEPKKALEKTTNNDVVEETYFKYKKWDSVNKSEEIYEIGGQKIHLKNYLNESKNEGGKKMYINGKEIDFIVSDAYVFTPYIFKSSNQEIILVREEDEGGIYGYILYYLKNNELINKSYLDVSPRDENISIDKFIEFKDENNTVIAKILTDKYYDTKSNEIKNSTQYNFIFNKDKTQNSIVQKTTKSPINSDFNTFDFSGQWQTDCALNNKISNILFYDRNDATIEMYNKGKLIAKLMLSFDRDTKSLKYVGTNVIGENINPQNIAGLSKGDVIGTVQLVENNQITISWAGLYNAKTKQKMFAQNPFSEKNSYTLKKCKP